MQMLRLGWLLAALLALTAPPVQPALAAHLPAAAALAQRYGIEIVAADEPATVPVTGGSFSYGPARASGVARYLPLLVAEFGLYPPDLIANTRLRRIVLCSQLTSNGQAVSALPAFGQDTLYYDVKQPRTQTGYLAKVIHHEFFHIIDYRDDGQLYADPAWLALNRPDFRYGAGGRARLGDSTQSLLTTAIPGFLTRYATAGVEEDKAEVFAHMMLDPAYVADRTWQDPVLRTKVVRLKEALAGFAQGMNESFWDAVASARAR